jgi:hypothetical protein
MPERPEKFTEEPRSSERRAGRPGQEFGGEAFARLVPAVGIGPVHNASRSYLAYARLSSLPSLCAPRVSMGTSSASSASVAKTCSPMRSEIS